MKTSSDEWVGAKQAPEQIFQFPSFVSSAIVYIRTELESTEQKLRTYIEHLYSDSDKRHTKEKFDAVLWCSLYELVQFTQIKVCMRVVCSA